MEKKVMDVFMSALVIFYEGHIQSEAEKEGKIVQRDLQQYGLSCHIHRIGQQIPIETDFVFTTHFEPPPYHDVQYFHLKYKEDKIDPRRFEEIRKNNPYATHLNMERSRMWIFAWARK